MNNIEIMSNVMACQSFPKLEEPQIHLENIIFTIQTILEGDTEVLFIEGSPGSGKTTLLAQFAMTLPNNAFSLFSRPTSKWAYDPISLQFDLCNQLEWFLAKRELPDTEQVDNAFLSKRLTSLRKRAKQQREVFYFIVDGLEEIPEAAAAVRQAILEMMPFGYHEFRFIFSGDAELYKQDLHPSVQWKNFPLPRFTLDQSYKYLSDFEILPNQIEEIHRMCAGVPGRLASIRRLLEKGKAVQEILDDAPSQLRDLFELEWQTSEIDNAQLNIALAVLAHGEKTFTLVDLAHLIGQTQDELKAAVKGITFLRVDELSGKIFFASEAFRSFAGQKLHKHKDTVHELLINELLKDPQSEDSLVYLPGYLKEAGKQEELIDYLSEENLTRMMEQGHSLVPIRQKLSLGLSAAKDLGRDGEMLRFSIKGSSLQIVSDVEVWRSEVKALAALDKFDRALALANSIVTIEDQLHLLAVLAAEKLDRGLAIEEELSAQIRQLCKMVDTTQLGDKALDIATDLIRSHPDLAIQLVEDATQSGDDENAMDWAMAKLSISAFRDDKGEAGAGDTIDQLRQRIQAPAAKSFSTTASLLLGNHSADEAIDEVKGLDKVSDQLYLLRLWATENREREDAWKISDYGLRLMLQSVDYSPNARMLRELATPIPFIREESKLRELIGRFDAQKLAVERAGPTEDYVRLELILARAEDKLNPEAVSNRLIEIYDYIDSIEGLVTKASCMARLLAALEEIDPEKHLEKNTGIHSIAYDDYKDLLDRLLLGTAFHFEATKRIIRALAKTRPNDAMAIVNRLNTETRRDKAWLELLESIIQGPDSSMKVQIIVEAINSISSKTLSNKAILKSLVSVTQSPNPPDKVIADITPLIEKIDAISDAGIRCNAYAVAITLLYAIEDSTYDELKNRLLDGLKESWLAIDPGYARIGIGFRIVEDLAKTSFDLASGYLDEISQFRNEIIVDSSEAAAAYDACLSLMVRALGGLIRANIDLEEDVGSFSELMETLHSKGHRAKHWGELALQFHLAGHNDKCREIVSTKLNPLIEGISAKDKEFKFRVIVEVAPAIYCAHKLSAEKVISELPSGWRDEAYARICNFIFEKRLPSDPYPVTPSTWFNLTYVDILDLITLLQQIREDSRIYYYLKQISRSVAYRPKATKNLSREQQYDIAEGLKNLAEDKFPNPNFIKHDGYKILSLAQIARFSPKQVPNWRDLGALARGIDNISDRAFVLTEIAEAVPPKEYKLQKQLIEEAEDLIKKIPSVDEQVDRYRALSDDVLQTDSQLARRYLKIAMELTKGGEGTNIARARKMIMDSAHTVDPEFAASLVSLLDEDRATAHLEAHLNKLNFKKDLASSKRQSMETSELDPKEYAEVAWMLLGSLNSGRINSIRSDQLYDFVDAASQLSLEHSFPIYSLIIENAITRWAKNRQQAATYLQPLFRALNEGTRFSLSIGARTSKLYQRAKSREVERETTTSIRIRSGERDKAINFIRDWFESSVNEYLKVCDPYFGPEDLEIVKLLCQVKPEVVVSILTSENHNKKVNQPLKQAYKDHWRIHLSDQDPPDSEITIVGVGASGTLPVHDRWWVTKGSGLRLGTSFNSLGTGRASEISIMTSEEASSSEIIIDDYLWRRTREYEGARVRYEIFSL